MTLTQTIADIFAKRASSPAQRAVNAGAPDAAKDPTDGQKRVGNYRKVHLNLDGFRISIENPKGSVRSGTAPDGTKWSNTLACDYGDIRGTESVDGDPVDIYLSDHPEKGAVFVIDQIDPKTKKFDEHKVMYGFDSIEDAKKTYLACYQKGWGGLGWITPVTKAEFRKWIDSSTRKTKPFHEYASVKPIVDTIKVKAAESYLGEKEAQINQDDPMEGVPAGVKLRSFIDAPATRTAIMDNVLEAVKNRFPIEDDDVRLELRDVKYEGPTSYTLEQQKQALLNNRRLGCSIAGTWRLTDKKTGQVLDERRDGVIRVPYYTDRGTIINNGNEYTVISQARLSPGVYVRRKQNGELESQFNVANGLGFRIGLDRETGALNMSIGQGHVPLYPVLRAIGVSDDDIRKSWGNEVTSVNVGKMDPRALDKVYARYAGRKADMSLSPADKAKFVKDALSGSGLDPDVVVRTLGLENVNGVTGQVILRAAQKLLNINRGAEDPDERDNPRFSRFYGVEDMMRERIDKDAGRLTKSILFRAKRDKNLARIGRNALAPYLDTFLSGSGLAMPGEEANPLSILTQQSRITRLGEGGISSPDLVTPEARNVQGDYLGFVDFISGPESFGIGIDVRAALGTMKGSDNRLYNKMMDLRTGKTRYVALDDAASHTVAFPGQDPNAPRLYVMRKGVPTMVPREEVDYMVPGFGNTVSMGINMTPMPSTVQAGRQFYMSKFWEQYLPQKEGEVPLVDSLMDDGKMTYSEFYGRKVGCLTAPFSGTVIKANDKEIIIRGKDGKTHTASLVQGLPFNRMTGLTYISQVKKGDEVQEGGIIANSNFTDAKTGAMNMGRNLKVAVLPAPEGVSSYEDAVVISEDAAKKLATSRLYGFEQDTKEGVQVARNKYLAAFPKAYTKAQADTIDENGVVKVGTVLHRDDPMILAIGPKMLSAEDAQLGNLSSVLRNALTDKSQKWEHDWPGVVTDVVAGANGVKVIVKSEPPVKVGDKISPEQGLKGVVGGILPMDKMPRDAATNEPYDMLMNPMGFLSRVAPGQIMLMNLAKVAKKTGKQIRIPQTPPPEGWLAWTEKQMADAGVKETADVFDPQTGRTIRNVGDGYSYVKAFHHLAEKKYSARGVDGAYTQDEQPAKGGEDGAKRMCFTADQTIRVLHGEESIGHIVDKRIPEYVWTRFDDGSWGYSLVTNWFCRKGKMSEVLSISVSYLPGSDNCSRKRVVYTDKTMHVTKQHHMYSFYKGEVLAGDLRPGDWLTTYGYVPTDDQMSLLMGSMLGDACICNVNDNLRKSDKACGVEAGSLPFYQEQHSHHQYAYLNWKVHCLGALVSSRKNTQRKSKTGFRRADGDDTNIVYCQIHRHDIAERLKNMFYRQPDGSLGRKNLDNVDLSKINDVGIVAWFLDDGCASEHKKNGMSTGSPFGSISTLSFTYEENCRLAEWLGGRLGTYVSVKTTHREHDGETREYYYLYMSADACRSMARLVARYVRPEDIPQSKKWLVKEVSRLSDLYVGVDTAYVLGSVPALVTSVRPYNDGKHGPNDEICLYDITVNRSHKYCASDCLVSNSGFDVTALLSHGATDVIKDSMTIRGSLNQDYWRRYRLGLPVEEPGVPFIYKKFLNTLKAGGVNVVEKGDVTSIMPQTDADIDELAQDRVLENSQMVDSDFQPVKGGMFDLGKTGGMGGNRWSMIVLPEAVPNPMMEEPVRRVLGLTAKKMEAVLSGREELNGKTGGDAIKEALSKIDIDDSIERARAEIKNRRGSQRDNAIKVLGYLKAAKEMGKKPEDWMITRVPVLPPMFRPVAKMGDVALVPDMNELYKDLIEMKGNYEALAKELPASALADERLAVYGAVKAAYGLGDPITAEGRAKNLKGAIRQVIGTIPKFGMYQSKVISKTQDNVGRSVTIPDKNLDMDQIGIPEDMAWEMYKPHVERKLVQRGYSPLTARQMIDEKNPTARHILDDAMEERPVLMDRAPTWHKFNIMAFKPHIVKGRSIHVCPLIDSGFNMDHDGDQSRSPYLTTLIKDGFFNTLPIDCDNNLCYNPCITKQVIEDRTMYKESAVINGEEVKGTVVNLKWDEFPHFDNPTVNSHPNARFYLVPDGVFVRAYDEKSGELVWAPVKYWSHHGVNNKIEVVTVELSSGRQIITDNDPRGVYGIDPSTMSFGRWRPSEAVGKFVPRCIKDNLRCEEVSSVELPDSSSRRTDSLKTEMPLDRTTGWFLGAMIGDGWASKKNGDTYVAVNFCFDSSYNDLYFAYSSAIAHAFSANDNPLHLGRVDQTSDAIGNRYGNVSRLTYTNSVLAKFIDSVIGHGADNKHLPPFWQKAPYEFRLGLFEGLMDTDGTLALVKAKAKKNVQLMSNFTSVSMTLATEVQYLCRTLGVDTKLTTQKTPAGGKCWQVSISTKNLKSLGLKLRSPHKAKALAEAEIRPDTSVGGRKYMIPVPMSELKKISSILLSLDKSAYVTFMRTSKKGYVPTTIADKIAKVLKAAPELQTDLWKKWLELYSNLDKIVWERVEGFTNTGMFEDGYDLTVPGYETFMNSEGVILSNTVNIHVPASMKAANQAMEKMLPSKNLFSLTDLKSMRYKPEKEQISGLWALTRSRTRKPTRYFNSKSEAVAAYRNGEIGPNDPIEIKED